MNYNDDKVKELITMKPASKIAREGYLIDRGIPSSKKDHRQLSVLCRGRPQNGALVCKLCKRAIVSWLGVLKYCLWPHACMSWKCLRYLLWLHVCFLHIFIRFSFLEEKNHWDFVAVPWRLLRGCASTTIPPLSDFNLYFSFQYFMPSYILN